MIFEPLAQALAALDGRELTAVLVVAVASVCVLATVIDAVAEQTK